MQVQKNISKRGVEGRPSYFIQGGGSDWGIQKKGRLAVPKGKPDKKKAEQ